MANKDRFVVTIFADSYAAEWVGLGWVRVGLLLGWVGFGLGFHWVTQITCLVMVINNLDLSTWRSALVSYVFSTIPSTYHQAYSSWWLVFLSHQFWHLVRVFCRVFGLEFAQVCSYACAESSVPYLKATRFLGTVAILLLIQGAYKLAVTLRINNVAISD